MEFSFGLKGATTVVALAALWTLEGLVPMFEGRSRRISHGVANIVLGAINAGVTALFFASAILLATEAARSGNVGLLVLRDLPRWLEWTLAFLLIDLWQYLWHRMNHRVGWLWRFHQVHHADRELDASSALRFHTGEIVLSSVARLFVLPLLGVSLGQLLLYEAVLLPVILFHHGNVRLPRRLDRVLQWVLVTPWMHWVHHSRKQMETDSNYSSVLSVWDRVFRTHRRTENPRKLRLGLDGMARSEWGTLRGMLSMPFRRGPRSDREKDDD